MTNRILDEERFPLVILGGPEQEDLLDLPGVSINEIPSTGNLKNLASLVTLQASQPHKLIFAEQGHMTKEFMLWLLNKQKKPIRLACLTYSFTPEGLMDETRRVIADITKHLGKAIAYQPIEFGFEPIPLNELALTFKGLKLDESCWNVVFIRHLGGVPKQTLNVANILRNFTEERLNIPLCFINFASTYHPFSYDPLCSRYANLHYRLANLDETAITELFSANGLRLDAEVVERVMQQTGGQPVLVQHLIRRLKEISTDNDAATLENVHEAMRRMRVSPPAECTAWLDHLKWVIKSNPALAHRFKAYVRGETLGRSSFPPPPEERELFVSGWLGLDQDERWGIASQFHAHLARQVLTDN